MPRGGCSYKSGVVMCAQGTLSEPAALVYMESKRPHKTYALLTNFNGVSLNSPHSCIAHPDGSLWFTDPHIAHKPSFRPRPKLPPLVYRFDIATADVRPMASDLVAPTSLAFSPDNMTLYVLDLPTSTLSDRTNGNSNSIPATTITLPQVFAYSVLPAGTQGSPFLTNKRLFAITLNDPTSLTTDLFGNVYIGCSNGVHVFDVGGCIIGRIMTDGPVTGICFGRGGELWVSLGTKLVKIQLGREIRGGCLGF
jgi:gluconolactonase